MTDAYKDAGVDIAKADQLIKQLGFSGYGAVIELGDTKIVLSTDGIGTKVLVAEQLNVFDTIGIDLVAMCANDILCHGAKPHSFLDYYATGHLNLEKSKEILSGIQLGCELAGCKLVGGETAEMPDVYEGDKFDLAGFCMGVVIDELPKKDLMKEGDVIIGIPSSGPHSNGFSLLRKLYHGIYHLNILRPTRIYTNDILSILPLIKGAAHITGGGIHGNLPRILPDNLNYNINIILQDWWLDLFNFAKMDKHEFESVFNCGWGMLLVVEKDNVDKITEIINDSKVLGAITN
jgi:phosphoribosylformylglycinamidine cyclo-ligase